MTRSQPWTIPQYVGVIDITPRYAPSTPHRPRPPKPVQPRGDDKLVFAAAAAYDPQPRDPGNDSWLPLPSDSLSRLDPQPRGPGNGRLVVDPAGSFALGAGSARQFGSSGTRPPKPPQPREPGRGGTRRLRRDPQPRDPGT